MAKLKWGRWAPLSGIVFVALLLASAFVAGEEPPEASDPSGQIAAYFADNRTALLIGGYLSGLALVFFIWFLASLAMRLRDGGEGRLAAVGLGGGLVLAAWGLASFSIQTLLAYRLAADVDAGIVKALYVVSVFNLGFGFPLFVLAAATSIAALRSRIFPRWFGLVGHVGALWFVVSGAAYYRNGFFAADGTFGFIAFLAFLAWVLLVSVLLVWQREEAPRTAAVPTA